MPDPVRIINKTLRAHTNAKQSMEAALVHLPKVRHFLDEDDDFERAKTYWKRLDGLDIGEDVPMLITHLRRACEIVPPPRTLRALYFTVPEIELNPPELDWAGFENFRASDTTFEWAAEEPVWPGDEGVVVFERAGFASVPSSSVLRAMGEALGLTQDRDELSSGLGGVLCSAPLAATAFLLADVFQAIGRELFSNCKQPVGVACGFASGDAVLVGTINDDGWTPGKPAKAPKKA